MDNQLVTLSRLSTADEFRHLERELFGNSVIGDCSARSLKERLLKDSVLPTTLIERREFMLDKCLSILEPTTTLEHTTWLWLFKATEMVLDVGHKLCPTAALPERKGAKTKKQLAATEDCQTMLSLYNKGILTLSSFLTVREIFHKMDTEMNDAIMLRFCDENAGYMSFVFGFDESTPEMPLMGSLSSEQIKDFKQGLAEILNDEPFPSKFDRLVKIESKNGSATVTLPRIRIVFTGYRTSRLQPDSVPVNDSETIRVNPLTGERLARTSSTPSSSSAAVASPPPNALASLPQLGQSQTPLSGFSLLQPPFLTLLQQQMAMPLPALALAGAAGLPQGFELAMLRSLADGGGDDRSEDFAAEVDMESSESVPISIPSALDLIFKQTLKENNDDEESS